MENKIFRKSISVDCVFYGFDPEIGLHFYFHYKPFLGLRHAREREREREREHHTHTDPLPHGSPSSTHSSLSAKRRPTVSFLFQLIHFSVWLHLTFDPHNSDLTSPPIHTSLIHTPLIHIPSNSDMPKSTLKPITYPSSDPPLGSDLYIYIYLFIYIIIYLFIYFF